MKKPHVIALSLTVLLLLILFAVYSGKIGGVSGGSRAVSGDKITELVVSIATPPETIDPQLNSSADGGMYLVHMNEGLFRYNWSGKGVELGLAKSVDVSKDESGNMVLTFAIREDAYWSDGKPVIAGDFVYTFRRLVNPATASPYGLEMGGFLLNGTAIASEKMDVDRLGVLAVDDKTLVVTFDGYCAFYDEILCFSPFSPVRQDMIEKYGDTWTRNGDTCITSGPYRMLEFANDERLVMGVNEHYYDKDALVATKITWQFLTDDAGLAAFRTGAIVLRNNFPQEEIPAMRAADVLSLQPTLGTYYVSFNNKVPILDNVNVRKALTLAIDRGYIVNTVLEGTAVAAEALVGDGFTDENGKEFRSTSNHVSYFTADNYAAQIEEAKAALAEAGYPDGKGFPTIEYMYNSGAGHELIAQALQNMWKEVLGINVQLVNQEWNVFLQTRREGNYQIARNGWLSDYNDPLSLLAMFVTGGGNNSEKYSNSEYDTLMTIATTSSSNVERMKAMRDAEDILIGRDWVCSPIYYCTQRYLVAKNLRDWTYIPVGYCLLHLAYLDGKPTVLTN